MDSIKQSFCWLVISIIGSLFGTVILVPEVFSDVRIRENVLQVRIRDEPATLDWTMAHTRIVSMVVNNIMEGLVYITNDLKVEGAIAESWSVSADRKTYTFKIRSNAAWSDGVDLTAEDFVYSWKRLLSPLTAAPYAYMLFDIVGAEQFNQGKLTDFDKVGVRALDKRTLQVELQYPVKYWEYIPSFWATFPLRKDILEKWGDTSWASPGKMVTAGPYVIISHDYNSNFMLKANAFYYRPMGNVDKLILKVVRDDQDAVTLFKKGELDLVANISAVDIKRTVGSSELHEKELLKTAYLAFATEKYPAANPRVRRAISMAIDRTKIVDVLFGDHTVAATFVPPGITGYSSKMGPEFNPAKAKKELLMAGFADPSEVKIELLYPAWDAVKRVAASVKSQLESNLGIRVNLIPEDNVSYRTKLELNAFALFFGTWTCDYPDPDNFLTHFEGPAGSNRTGWSNKDYNDLIDKARVIQSETMRNSTYLQLQKMLIEDHAVVIPLYYERNLALIKDRVKNLKLNSMDYFYLGSVNVSP